MLGDNRSDPDTIHPEQIVFAIDVFGDTASENVDTLFVTHFLNSQVDHPSEFLIVGLEEFSDAEEQSGAFTLTELLSLVDQVHNLPQQVPTSLRH